MARNFRGGMPNMNNMMKQVKKMQEEMEKPNKNQKKRIYCKRRGGVVEATVTGKKVVTSIKINPDVVDPEDVDMLQDLIMVAINDANNQADKFNEENMGRLTGGINIPGLM